MQNEIKQKGNLLNDKGFLNEAGYAKTLQLNYDRNQIKSCKLKIKEWDYYIVTDGKIAVAFTIADNSYMGLYSVSYLDFEKNIQHTKTQMKFFTLGKTKLPSTSQTGDVAINLKNMQISFTKTESSRVLKCHCEKLDGANNFDCELVLTDFPKESMVIASPFVNGGKCFYYNQKINCMRAEGTVNLGGIKHTFDKNNATGTLDWGRGVWKYDNTWYWGSMSAILQNGDKVGFNIGYGFADTTSATEDMIFFNGTSHKLDRVIWDIPQKDGKEDFLQPWKFTSTDNRFNLTFTPVMDRFAHMNVGVLLTNQHQVFGKFNGELVLDDKKVVKINDVLGFAEKVRNKY
ncbi:MAG: DUF2804 domain-containing protein [Clostridia bacterium]